MKDIILYALESLSTEDIRNLESIIKSAQKYDGLDIDKPFFFMSRIPKKREFHIYPCKDRAQLEEYYEKSKKEPLVFGRFQALRSNKEDFKKITNLWTFKKDHYKIIEEQ